MELNPSLSGSKACGVFHIIRFSEKEDPANGNGQVRELPPSPHSGHHLGHLEDKRRTPFSFISSIPDLPSPPN